jgi:hypothetical protein
VKQSEKQSAVSPMVVQLCVDFLELCSVSSFRVSFFSGGFHSNTVPFSYLCIFIHVTRFAANKTLLFLFQLIWKSRLLYFGSAEKILQFGPLPNNCSLVISHLTISRASVT